MDSFTECAALLPPLLRQRALALPEETRRRAEEIRLRAGRLPTVTVEGDELSLPGAPVTGEDLALTVEIATRASPQHALDRLKQGYFTVPGGHRVGLCGTLTAQDERVVGLEKLSSLNIRVAHAVPGCAAGLLPALAPGGRFESTLILAPPGGGKTTLLRDLIRLLSDGEGVRPMRVGLCDQRGEVAALWEGEPRFDVGARTDVVEGCPKGQGVLMLLRGMNPQVLSCDEITDPADLAALTACAHCGCTLLCTAHATGVEDLALRPLYRKLLESRLFRRAVILDRATRRCPRVEELPWRS